VKELMQIFQRSKERTMSELHPGSKERTMSELHPEKEAEIQRTIAEGFAAPATPASELPQWAIEEAYAIVTEHSWGWPENASDELTDDQEQHCTDLAASLVQIVGRYKAQPPDAEAERLKQDDLHPPSNGGAFVWDRSHLHWVDSCNGVVDQESSYVDRGRMIVRLQVRLRDTAARLAEANTPLEGADNRISITQHPDPGWFTYDIPGANCGPFSTWREAYANAALALEIRRLAEVEAGAAELRAACEESRAFIGIMFGCGPDAVIPTTVVTPLGVPVKLAEVFQRLDAALQPSPVTNRAIEILGGGE
jgi:hypothetical protein